MKTGFVFAAILAMCCAFVKSNSTKTTPYVFPETPFFPKKIINPNNLTTKEGVELGRYLFYDPILSRDSSFSCASCHKQEFAFSGGPEPYSKGLNGILQKRNTPPLFNLAWMPSLFWDGRAESLEEQCFEPVRNPNEMDLPWPTAELRIKRSIFYKKLFAKAFPSQEIDSILIANAVSQFQRSLISNNSRFDKILAGNGKFTLTELRGFELVNDQSMAACLYCHVTEGQILGTTNKFANNGLDPYQFEELYTDRGLDEVNKDKNLTGSFKIPSFRNLVFTAPYMHDGRFKNLDEVVEFYSSGVKFTPFVDSKMTHAKQGGVNLSESDKKAVVAFLITLSDSSFITNPAFSNPFN